MSITKAPIADNYYNINDGGFGGHGEYYVQPVTENQLKGLEYGRHLPASEKLKQILSNYRKNVVVSNTTKEKLSKLQKDKICINNGTLNKYVNKAELDTYLNNG